MNFKDLQLSINKLKQNIASQVVKNNPMSHGSQSLSMWIFQERNCLAELRTLNFQRSEANKAMQEWVKEEVKDEGTENGSDLEDIVGDKLFRLLDKQTEIENEYADKMQKYRQTIKLIREREGRLDDVRNKKRDLQSRISNLSNSNSKSPKLTEYHKELESLKKDTHESEMDLADFKRFALKEAFYLRFNAMNEYAQKTALIAGFGKYLIDLINIEPTPSTQQNRTPYKKGADAAIILADAISALNGWTPNVEDERFTLADLAADNANNKGKSPETATGLGQDNIPPKLPQRRLSKENVTVPHSAEEAAVDAAVVGSTAPAITTSEEPAAPVVNEPTQSSGEAETQNENEINMQRIDLYDAPPAYDSPSTNSDPQQQYHQTQQYSSASFSSPYPSHANLPPAQHPAYVNLTDSPAPMHNQQSQQQQQHWNPHRQESSFYEPNNTWFNNQTNYQQLYRQVSQRQHNYNYRPYSEFQQQYVYNPQEQDTGSRQRVDAGGFRVPTAPTPQEDDEKVRLAKYYKQQEQQYDQQQQQLAGNNTSYSEENPHQYANSQYNAPQYEGSQYGELQYNTNNLVQDQQQQQQQVQHPTAAHSPSLPENQNLEKPNYEQKALEE